MERIHVAVRSRPLSPEDARSSPWRISGNTIAHSAQASIRFDFDRIFGEECRTAEVYEARTKRIVDSVVRGFNGTVFAYGQTNSGKTYTMRGSATEPGIIPLAVHDLFQRIEEHMDREFLVRMSYMEIYNEDINDLLVPEHRKLQIHESTEKGIFVAGLREEIVTCAEQVMNFMSFGESHRHIGETNMNLYSSRSHTIFRMVIESREKGDDSEADDSCDAVRVSVLNLVDLAGSERAAKTGAEGVRLKEGSHINKSLMILGTVIKKLSEGIEGQGGHVPYRDSKLTRILQPALGGNSNTAIICNITLAQVHADETKSSLQFASRALRVTNCACVNEILTDAALLKRQRKEIEELRAKLRNSQSDHWGEEILNLRNTLLQSELEKERIALELEEEKKAKEQRDRRLIEQAKKIENLSSMVLNSERDDRSTAFSKDKRRVTWCAGPNARQIAIEVLGPADVGPTRSAVRNERNMGMPPCFEELMQGSYASNDEPAVACSSSDMSKDSEDLSLPDSHALLHVTNRRKASTMRKSDQEQFGGSAGELIIPQEPHDDYDALQNQENHVPCAVSSLSARESEAILVIKQLQDQIKLLEAEKSSIQINLDDVLELATQQKTSFSEKYEELQQNTLAAQEQAKVANEKLSTLFATAKSKQEVADGFLSNLLMETRGINLEMDQLRNSAESALSFIDELCQNLLMMAQGTLELKHSAHEDITQFSSIVRDYEKLSTCLMEKVCKLESEKALLEEQSQDQQNEIDKLKSSLESCEKAIDDCTLQHELEKDGILSDLLNLQKEVSTLSSSSLMKEKESIRKELDRTKTKLRETENKLKNSIQEKIKLQSEKAEAHKEVKKLQSQRTLLERDLRKRDSGTVDKRHEQNSMPQELAGVFDQAVQMQEEYQKLKMHAFDMEEEISFLREALTTSIAEKDEALSKLELVTSELEDLASKLNSAELERNSLSDEIALLNKKSNASESALKRLEASLNSVSGEKEDMGMQLTDALLDIESERSIWTAKEKEYLEANQKLNIYLDENRRLSEDLIKELHKQLLMITEERNSLLSEIEQMRLIVNEAEVLKENCNRKLIHAQATIDELSSRISIMEVNMNNAAVAHTKEKTKLRLQIRALQPELDAHRGRLKEAVDKNELMDAKYKEASTKLKEELYQSCCEVLRLREMLKESQGT
ncbi:unnamed protein product [Urochloa humidicola]